jgi:phosphotransacetylase
MMTREAKPMLVAGPNHTTADVRARLYTCIGLDEAFYHSLKLFIMISNDQYG